jgi:hypothetical protein
VRQGENKIECTEREVKFRFQYNCIAVVTWPSIGAFVSNEKMHVFFSHSTHSLASILLAMMSFSKLGNSTQRPSRLRALTQRLSWRVSKMTQITLALVRARGVARKVGYLNI